MLKQKPKPVGRVLLTRDRNEPSELVRAEVTIVINRPEKPHIPDC